jgi:hypothetical protein
MYQILHASILGPVKLCYVAESESILYLNSKNQNLHFISINRIRILSWLPEAESAFYPSPMNQDLHCIHTSRNRIYIYISTRCTSICIVTQPTRSKCALYPCKLHNFKYLSSQINEVQLAVENAFNNKKKAQTSDKLKQLRNSLH